MENTQKIWEPIDFTAYLRFALPWALLAAAVEIIFRMFSHWLGTGPLFDYQQYYIWGIRGAAIAFIAWREFRAFGPDTAVGAIAGLFAGSVVGLAVSIYMIIESFKIWKIFNIFSETVFLAVLAAAVLITVSFIFKNKKQ